MDSDTPPHQWDAIARFLAGDASAGDSAEVRQWLSAHPADAAVVTSLDALLSPCAADARLAAGLSDDMLAFGRPLDVQLALTQLHAKIDALGNSPALAEPGGRTSVPAKKRSALSGTSHTSTGRRVLWGIAALLVSAVGITSWRTRSSGDPALAALTYTTPVGAGDSVLLSDGTHVILGPGSRLTVATNYGARDRAVELEGAGLFTVKHDAERPFRVRVGKAVIQDLGTVFTAKVVDDAGVTVSVTEGSVELSDADSSRSHASANLGAGDRGRLLPNGTIVSQRGAVTPEESGWVRGRLVYRDAPLAEVQADLRRWYGVELVVADSVLRALSVTTDALASEPVSRIVDRLAASWGATASRRGDTLFVDRPGATPRH